jgi:hypothetical protein
MSEWRFAGLGGSIFANFGELKRQSLLGNDCRYFVFIIDGEGLAPVALAAEYSITQAVVDLYLT